jgi:two-component system chemotaxis sensor kinase CheA
MRLLQTGKTDVSPLRLLAFDISELRRKEDILRTVSGYLEAHKNIMSEGRKTLKALLDSLPLAVFMIDRTLRVTSETSLRAHELFGEKIAEKSLAELTALSPSELEPLDLTFSGVPWDLMRGVLPKEFVKGDRIFSLSFVPLFEQQMLIAVTVIVDDVTEHRVLRKTLERKDEDNRALISILASRDEFFDLITLAEKAGSVTDSLSEFRPLIHSLKGGFSFLECESFASKCHSFEEELNPVLYTPDAGRRFVSDLSREITEFVSRYGELLKVSSDPAAEKGKRTIVAQYDHLGQVYHRVREAGVGAAVLQDIEKLAESPIESLLGWLDKAWSKTLAREEKEGKPIVWEGGFQIAREPHKELFQSFVHIIRNAVDHGIERPEDRILANKNRAGRMCITSSYDGEFYTIAFKDDGVGITAEKVLEKAKTRGIDVANDLSREQILMLICEPGFSSKDEITELSGCGIGLDAVRRCARACGGDVAIESEPGVGTTITVCFKRQPYW